MSFFSNLQQYVSDSVASLNLSPKRFPFGRDNSGSGNAANGASSAAATAASTPPTAAPHQHGNLGPKIVPSPSAASAILKPSQSASAPNSPARPMLPPRAGSGKNIARNGQKFKKKEKKVKQFLLCDFRHRTFPEYAVTGSGLHQEPEANFFDTFSSLAWKLETRRVEALREPPPREVELSSGNTGRNIPKKEMELLYVEVLYTITHKIGATTVQYSHLREDLEKYAKLAFGIGDEHHRKFINIASEEKPPIVVLNMIVIEAEGLEAKDANGYSDPYCMIGINPGSPTPGRSGSSPRSSPGSSRETSRQPSLDIPDSSAGTVQSPVQVLTGTLGFSDPYCMLDTCC